MSDLQARFEKALADSKEAQAQERELFQKLETIEAKYGPVALDIVGMALAGKKDEATAKMNAECQPLLKQLIGTTSEYTKFIATSGDKEIQKAADKFSTKRLTLILAAIAAVLAALALATLINRSLMRSLGADPLELSAAAKRVASGNLGPVPGSATAPGSGGDAFCLLDRRAPRIARSTVVRTAAVGHRPAQFRGRAARCLLSAYGTGRVKWAAMGWK